MTAEFPTTTGRPEKSGRLYLLTFVGTGTIIVPMTAALATLASLIPAFWAVAFYEIGSGR